MSAAAVDDFLDAVTSATMGSCRAFGEQAVLDATVPNWRFEVRGVEAVTDELGRWYADPGHFEDLRRTPIAGGEVVEFTLSWQENEVPHACHQVHVLELDDGRIVADRAWCGGRWPEPLLADMAAAAQAQS